MARVHPLDRDRIRPGEEAFVRLALDRPIGALAGDRLVLRDAGASRTIGGGNVIDPFPPARGRRTPARLAQLAALRPAAMRSRYGNCWHCRRAGPITPASCGRATFPRRWPSPCGPPSPPSQLPIC